jgi:tagaturonate reductase
MKMRNVPLLLEHYNRFNNVPQYMAIGFAAYLLFMKAATKDGDKYFGNNNGTSYHIQDEFAGYYFEVWQNYDSEEVVKAVLSNESIWSVDLNKLEGFADAVTKYLKLFMNNKFFEVIENIKSLEVKI